MRALLSLWMVYGLRPWRPLRHTACATSPASAGEALGYNGIIASPVATGEVASMRADGGRSWLACTSNAMKVYSLRSWRPLHRLRGPPPPLWQGRLEVHSVPLRGYGFEMSLAAGCLAVPSSICRFAARMYFPPLSRRHCVLKAAVCPTALSAAGISLSV